MASRSSYLDDFEFIIDEIIRIHDLLQKYGPKALPNNLDFLCSLPHPRGSGMLVIGQAPNNKFFEIAEKAVKHSLELKHRVKAVTLYNSIKHNFYEEIIIKKKTLTKSLADRIVGKSISYVRKNKLVTLVHFFPCMLPLDSKSDQFSIGPIVFQTTKRFFEEKESQFKNHAQQVFDRYLTEEKERIITGREKIIPGDNSDWPFLEIKKSASALERELREYFENYPWVV